LKKVIIVDDHSTFRNSLKLYLESTGEFEIINCAENGNQAIAYLETEMPDLLILDIEMPELNGVKTLRYIKSKYPSLLVLVLSFYNNVEMQHRIMSEGASGVLCKSVELDDLKYTIEKIFEEKVYISFEIGKYMILNNQHPEKQLNNKELLMIQLLLEEKKIEEIATKLNLSKRSAENLRLKIKDKIGVKTSYGIVQYAIKNGFLHFTN
jgi:DNA-binding NarL/FixJ family response regulator